jgi:hypothetical protein
MMCVCEESGEVRSAVRGILAGPPNNRGNRVIERCDTCKRFSSDEAAGLWYARAKGGTSRYSYGRQTRVLWCRK